ncbi:hypothetical protein V5P93_003983 [Actinokineospora auranticolor]|uniref:Lipoprotein n=1 Tax=Actinokineospora auranticolor TaxID=155976 RepID=A0A2S6GB66_9PSEU|nr:hypothetical protein [Actinokineospora auranticolor]PPK60681.1 hypothetical protein CLV40_1498 [Actinokineospora auranticolor]
MPKPPEPPPLLTQRAAIILALGVGCGLLTAVLTVLAGGHLAAGVLTGLVTIGGAITFFNKIIH